MTKEMNVNQKAVQFLIGVACRRETTYYEAIAEHCGLPAQGNQLSMVVSKLLGEVFRWCEKKGWPPLTALVVRKSGKFQGQHGLGFWKIAENSTIFARNGIEDWARLWVDEDYQTLGRFLIVKVWHYFADLSPLTNVNTLALGVGDAFGQGVSNHSEEFGEVMKVLNSIPGYGDLPEDFKDKVSRGLSLIGAEMIQDHVTARIADGMLPIHAWNGFRFSGSES